MLAKVQGPHGGAHGARPASTGMIIEMFVKVLQTRVKHDMYLA